MTIGDSGFVINNATSFIHVYTFKKTIYDEPEFYNGIGKVVKMTGTVNFYFKNNQKQIVNYTMTDVEETFDFENDFSKTTASGLVNFTNDKLKNVVITFNEYRYV